MQKRTALIIGASGLAGGHCLDFLLQEETYSKVVALVRKPLLRVHEKLEQQVINFDDIEKYRSIIKAEDIFCCIGTTALKSPNREAYYKIDFTYPYSIAKIAKENGAEKFALVSALSASPNAPLFYSRVKGELEEAIIKLNFKCIVILRPSYLIGNRLAFRPIEKLGVTLLQVLKPLLIGPLKKYRAIEAKTVAYVMVKEIIKKSSGTKIILNNEIQEFCNNEL